MRQASESTGWHTPGLAFESRTFELLLLIDAATFAPAEVVREIALTIFAAESEVYRIGVATAERGFWGICVGVQMPA